MPAFARITVGYASMHAGSRTDMGVTPHRHPGRPLDRGNKWRDDAWSPAPIRVAASGR